MQNKESTVRTMLETYFHGYDFIEQIVPLISGLIDRVDDVGPILSELLSDDPLVEKISGIYERGSTLWFALKEDQTVANEAGTAIIDLVDDYCSECPDGNDEVCETCHIRKMMDRFYAALPDSEIATADTTKGDAYENQGIAALPA